MLRRFGSHVRNQWAGFLALFLVLTGGTAYALNGSNTVFSDDIVDGEVKRDDIAANAVATGKIAADQIFSADVRDDTFVDGGLAREDLALGSVAGSEVADASLTGTDILNGSLSGADITGLTGSDIIESTLTALDGHDSYDAKCDPGTEVFIICDEIFFTLGRPMQVSVSWAYAMGTDGDVNANGLCRTTLDGIGKSGEIWLSTEDDSDFSHGGVPVVDVMSLAAGLHKVGFACREHQPDGKDLVIRELTMSVVELGFD